MLEIRDDILVRGHIRPVFTFAAQPANMPRWNMAVLESKVRGSLRRGAVVEQRIDLFGRRFSVLFEVTCYWPFHRVTYASIWGPIDVEGTMEFQAAPGGTLIRWLVCGDCRRFLHVADPLLARLGRRSMHECLKNLRRLHENGPALDRTSHPIGGRVGREG